MRVKYKNFQLIVLKDTRWSTEHDKVGIGGFKSGFQYIWCLILVTQRSQLVQAQAEHCPKLSFDKHTTQRCIQVELCGKERFFDDISKDAPHLNILHAENLLCKEKIAPIFSTICNQEVFYSWYFFSSRFVYFCAQVFTRVIIESGGVDVAGLDSLWLHQQELVGYSDYKLLSAGQVFDSAIKQKTNGKTFDFTLHQPRMMKGYQ